VGRRNGKIAHLPEDQRNLINRLFDEGATYEAVSRRLAEQGASINLQNLSDWFHGGYQDLLQQRERLSLIRESQQRLLEFATKGEAPDLLFTGLQLGITQLAQQISEIAPGSHKQSFQTDTDQYLRMLNTLGRMGRSLLALQKHKDEIAKAAATELKDLDINRELNDNEYELIAARIDRAFKVRRPTPPPAPNWDQVMI
jgi:hypothetical protein